MKSSSELREILVRRAVEDMDFRARLLASPKEAIREELPIDIPDSFKIEVLEDGPSVAHLVLPPVARLDEADLKAAQGGWPNSQPTQDQSTQDEGYGVAYTTTDSGPYSRI